jgi:diguanylate cyclase (GGDEF)-like protein
MGVLVYKNSRIAADNKRVLYLTYVLIAAAALAEWCGLQMADRPEFPKWLLKAVKCADYILTPMAGGALILQMKLRNSWQKIMMGILAANIVAQLIAVFTDWMISIDAANHYTHGPMFPLYICMCLAVYLLIILQFTVYGRSFKEQNQGSLYAVMLIVMAGIGMQELLPNIRTAYLGMTIGAALMFIHYNEFSQMLIDTHIAQQQKQLQTDDLTGLMNRYSYSLALNGYAEASSLPEDFAAYTVDINDLKQTNDTLGHEAGDELIRGAAECIRKAFGGEAGIYRTGGDEFVILNRAADTEGMEADLDRLKAETNAWTGSAGQKLSLAAGGALAKDHPGLNAEELARISDLAMYESKAEYYKLSGHERRGR